jgi:hypothetical protein
MYLKVGNKMIIAVMQKGGNHDRVTN